MIPKMTNEQRLAALEKAMQGRKVRAALKKRIKAGEVPLADALAHPDAQDMRARQFIAAFPGIGDARATAIMKAARIAETRHIRALGTKQRSNLLEIMAKS
ncbi:MAG: integration host factor, actinobacterial type [Gordonibacter sp.]|uniref:integration host factor, actinobacterial type n=1 Tax=Gordonibacter sp. TaxID=1968902 RepID=UPI002FC604E1